MVINDTRYEQDVIDNQIITLETIGINPKDLKTTKDNPNDIPWKDIDPNKLYEVVLLDDTLEEIRKKHRSRLLKNHPISNVIGNVNECVVTRRQTRLSEMGLVCYTSQLEPKNVKEALGDESWTISLQEELNQFTRNDMWYLVPKSNDKHVIGTKWIFKNKHDEMRSLWETKVY